MQLRNIFTAILISPELVLVLGVCAVYINFPAALAFLGSKLVSDSENWKYVAAVPPVLIGWSFKVMSEIRNPSDMQQNKLLYLWPGYPLLIGRLYVAIAIASFAAIASVALCLLGRGLRPEIVGAVFVATMAVSLVVSAGLTFARDRLRELLTQHG